MKIAVVDIDDTLLSGGKLSRFFWRISLTSQRIGRRLQKVNRALLSELANYDTVIIVSGRDKTETTFTGNQLKRTGLKFDELICCPRKTMINNWKMSVVTSLGEKRKIVWIDDIFESGSIDGNQPQLHRNITTLSPTGQMSNNSPRSSELEWL